MLEFYEITTLILPALVLASLVLGLLVERIIMGILRRAAVRTKWLGDKVLVRGLHGAITIMFVLAGLYVTVLTAGLDPTLRKLGLDVVLSVFVLVATVAMGRVASGFVELYAAGIPGIQPSTSIFTHITKALVYVIGILIVLAIFRIPIAPLLTALGVGGLGIALALRDTLSNLFAGLHLVASRQIRVGDFIQFDAGHEGYVDDINWRNTTVRSLAGNMVIVPNANLAASIITNFNQPEQHMDVNIQVGVEHGTDLARAEAIALETAEEVMEDMTEGLVEFRPTVRYTNLAEAGVMFLVTLRVHEFGGQYALKHEFIKRMYERFQNENIKIT